MNYMLLRLNKHPINVACFEDGTVALDLSAVEGNISDQLKDFYILIDNKSMEAFDYSPIGYSATFKHGVKYDYKEHPRLKAWLKSFNLGL